METHTPPSGAASTTGTTDSNQPDTRRGRKPRHRAVPLTPEVRHFKATGLEVRSSQTTDEIVITGAPIVYDQPYDVTDMFGTFEERMASGVADGVLANGADVRFLFNHDGLPLARSTSGTMRLWSGDHALQFEARLDARQQLANDLAIAIQRGDVSQMSCGFIVDRDEWDEDMEHRVIYRFADLLDVSAVTYPCSPTTSIEVAHRMLMERPVESVARVRRFAVDLRAGKVLSGANAQHIKNAHEALSAVLEAGGYGEQPAPDDDDDSAADTTVRHPAEGDSPNLPDTAGDDLQESDGTVGGHASSEGAGPGGTQDGTGIRNAPSTTAERREASMSYNDQQCAVYQALLAKYGDGDGDCDLWVCDMGDDWVVFENYLQPMGLWRVGYSLGSDGTATLTGDPQKVSQVTTYEPDAPPAPPVFQVSRARVLAIQAEARKRRRR